MATGSSSSSSSKAANEPGVMEKRTAIKDYDGDSGAPIVTRASLSEEENSGVRTDIPDPPKGVKVDLGFETDGEGPTVTVDKSIADKVTGEADEVEADEKAKGTATGPASSKSG